MAATGNEAVTISQLKMWGDEKLSGGGNSIETASLTGTDSGTFGNDHPFSSWDIHFAKSGNIVVVNGVLNVGAGPMDGTASLSMNYQIGPLPFPAHEIMKNPSTNKVIGYKMNLKSFNDVIGPIYAQFDNESNSINMLSSFSYTANMTELRNITLAFQDYLYLSFMYLSE